jgi:CTP:molybdopterin cytidylyltransferase MocA
VSVAYTWKDVVLSTGATVVLEVEDESLPLSVGLTVVPEFEDGSSLSLSAGLAVVVLEADDVLLLALDWVVESAELLVALAVVLEVTPFAELDELLETFGASGDHCSGFWGAPSL